MATMQQSPYDVIIIGGGASGLMAAAVAAEQGERVLLLEKNGSVGKKLSITGGGRCNIMNGEPNLRTLLSHYGDAAKFLHSPFSQFGIQETTEFFETKGLALKQEARQRLFPQSERASDVVAFFAHLLERTNVTIRTNEAVRGFEWDDGMITGVLTSSGRFTAARYILATGGLSHPETGSTGDGHTWLATLGHTIHRPDPALVPLVASDWWVHDLAGTSLEHARITFTNKGGTVEKTGRILFTHFGLSGPTILNAAAEVRQLFAAGSVRAYINLFPGMDDAVMQKHVYSTFIAHRNKSLKNVLKLLVPPGLSNAVTALLPAELGEAKTHSITRASRQQLIALLYALPLTITDTKGNDWSIVSNGGLDLTEVDTRSMRSRFYENLFVTGDVLHITRPSGGYSLQLCWTTGAVAGMNQANASSVTP